MPVLEINGKRVEFSKMPTEADIDEAAAFLKSRPTKTEENPKESIPQMFGRNITKAVRETYTEGVSPILSGLSTAAFGAPRQAIKDPLSALGLSGLAKKFAPQIAEKIQEKGKSLEKSIFPEQETGTGKATRFVSEVAGIFGGGASKLAKMAGEKIIGKTLPIIGKKILKGAAEGATLGGTQITGEPSLKRQATQATIGGISGGFLGVLSKSNRFQGSGRDTAVRQV